MINRLPPSKTLTTEAQRLGEKQSLSSEFASQLRLHLVSQLGLCLDLRIRGEIVHLFDKAKRRCSVPLCLCGKKVFKL